MGLEVATYIADLVATNPLISDPVGQGDDHLRLLKSTVKNTFPNLGNRYARVIDTPLGYTVLASDNTALVEVPTASAGTITHTISLPAIASITAGFYVDVIAGGPSDVVIFAPTGGATIDGSATLTVGPRVWARAFYRGTNWGLAQFPIAGTASNDLSVNGNLFVSGTSTLSGTVHMNGNLTVSGAALVSGTLRAGGDITGSSNLTIAGAVVVGAGVAIGATLSVSGAAAFNSSLTVSGATNLGGTLSVAAAATFSGTASISGATHCKTTLSVGGAATLGTTLTVSGASVLSGAATLGSTLSVSGAAVFSSGVDVRGALMVDSTATVSGAAHFHTTMSVGGAATFGSTASVSGGVHCKATLSVGGVATFASTVTISGTCVLVSGQLNFPATQNASADANTLDDYEEGAFTPVLTLTTPGTLSIVYSTQNARYTKIGRMVQWEVNIVTTTFTLGTATGAVSITGLPLSAASVAGAALGRCSGFATGADTQVEILVNGNNIALTFITTTTGAVANVTDVHATTGVNKSILISGVFSV